MSALGAATKDGRGPVADPAAVRDTACPECVRLRLALEDAALALDLALTHLSRLREVYYVALVGRALHAVRAALDGKTG